MRCTFQYLEAVTPPRLVSQLVGPVLFCLWPSNPVDGSSPQSPLPPPVKLVNGRERRSVAVEIGSEGTSERRTLSSSGCVVAPLSASWATPVPVDSAAWRVQRCAPCNSSTGTSVTEGTRRKHTSRYVHSCHLYRDTSHAVQMSDIP